MQRQRTSGPEIDRVRDQG